VELDPVGGEIGDEHAEVRPARRVALKLDAVAPVVAGDGEGVALDAGSGCRRRRGSQRDQRQPCSSDEGEVSHTEDDPREGAILPVRGRGAA